MSKAADERYTPQWAGCPRIDAPQHIPPGVGWEEYQVRKGAAKMSKGTDERYTPQWVLDLLPRPPDLDPCSPAECRTGAARWWTVEQDGLSMSWGSYLRNAMSVVWVNPPYSRGQLARWIAKVYSETRACATMRVYVLTPSDLSTDWARLALGTANNMYPIHRRIAFDSPEGAPAAGAKFGSVIWSYGPFSGLNPTADSRLVTRVRLR